MPKLKTLSSLIPDLSISTLDYFMDFYKYNTSIIENPIKAYKTPNKFIYIFKSNTKPNLKDTVYADTTDPESLKVLKKLQTKEFYFIVAMSATKGDEFDIEDCIFLTIDEAIEHAQAISNKN